MNEAKIRTKDILENLDQMLSTYIEKKENLSKEPTSNEDKIGNTLRWINANLDRDAVLKIARDSLFVENYEMIKILLNSPEYDPNQYN